MSTRQLIVDEIMATFREIKIDNGYNFDLGDEVYCWKSNPVESAKSFLLNIKDTTDNVSLTPYNKSDHTLTVVAELYARGGANKVEDIRKMMEDVNRAIGSNWTWDGLAIKTHVISNDIEDVEHVDRLVVVGRVTFAVTYRTDLFEI